MRKLGGKAGAFEQRLGGDTTPQHARSAERLALDDGDGKAELRATECAHVTGGTAAKDDDVVGSHRTSRGGVGAQREAARVWEVTLTSGGRKLENDYVVSGGFWVSSSGCRSKPETKN